MGLFSRFTKKKEQVGASQDKEGNSAATSPHRRPSFEGKFPSLPNKTSPALLKDSGVKDKLVTQISSSSSLQKDSHDEGLPVGVEESFGGSRSSGRIIPLMDSEPKKVEAGGDSEAVLTPKSPPGFEHPEAESSFDTDRGGHFAGTDRPPFSEPAYRFHMEGEGRHAESESDSSGEEGGSEREEEEREENESELGGGDEDRFGNEGGRFEQDADFYGTKKEEAPTSEGGYCSEGGQTAEQRLNEEGREYHSEGMQGVGLELSEREADVQTGEQVSDGRNEAGQEVTSPEEGPPSSKSVRDSGEVWDQRREGGELPKSDNEALTLAAAWEKEKNKKKPWWKVFGPSSHHQRKHSGDSGENLTPRSGTESEPRRDLSPMSDTAALQRKDSAFRGRQLDVEKQSEDSPRSRSPLWFFRREGAHKRGGDSGSPTSPPGAGAHEFSSPRASNGSLMVREASPMPKARPEEPANPVAPAVASKSEEGYTALLRREHLRAVPERREMSWVKEWVSKVDPAEPPSDIEPEVELPEEPTSPPSWQGNLLLGPSPREPEAPVKATGGVHVSADLVFANAVASEVDIRAAAAYLGARGLKMVPPSLSIFGALKTLDLSRNAIAHIPSGVLPRGLHYLDLSFNKLTAVEGLRELTRLRVLNLHANRIVRIGHGLATCQSLRELHLSGNKIGEVEGLHRLLKLQVLDLSDNKISSTKSLGQLAANYSSLQALNLIGNPVLASLGADQLRRFIVGLVPQVMYLNKQTLKTLSGRDAAVERMVLGSKGHSSARGSKREKAHGKLSPRRGRASASSAAGPSSKRSSMGRSKSSSRLAAPPAVSHHHHHHHRTSSQSRHRSSGGHTGHHNAHSISRERASSDVQPGLPKVSSPMKPPRHPSISGAPVDAPPAGQTANGFEFNIPRVYSEGALETPHRLVKQYSGEF